MCRNEAASRRKELKKQEATNLAFRPAIANISDLPRPGPMSSVSSYLPTSQALNLSNLLQLGNPTSNASGLMPLDPTIVSTSSYSTPFVFNQSGAPLMGGFQGFANPFAAGPQIVNLSTVATSGVRSTGTMGLPLPTVSLPPQHKRPITTSLNPAALGNGTVVPKPIVPMSSQETNVVVAYDPAVVPAAPITSTNAPPTFAPPTNTPPANSPPTNAPPTPPTPPTAI